MNYVVSQALATGLPVIATRHSGLPEQVLDGQNGFLVDEGDYTALAERILTVSRHPELLAALGKSAREHVSEHYNSPKLIEVQLNVYLDLAGARRDASPRP